MSDMYPMQQIPIQWPEFNPDNPFTEIAIKVGARVADTLDDLIMKAIYEEAKNEGFTHLYLLDKTFIMNALRHELERWKED